MLRRWLVIGAVALTAMGEALWLEGQALPGPSRQEAETWLGRFSAGVETLTFEWVEGRMVLWLNRVRVPVDGRWHETEATFAVRHRANWLAEGRGVRVEEQHNYGAYWIYELRLGPEGEWLQKWQRASDAASEATLIRTFQRHKEGETP